MAFSLLRSRPMRDHRGFTLIEVLLVIVLLGVLSGIAIAQYESFRARGLDARVASVVRHVATGEEAYFASRQRYTTDVDALDVSIDDVGITITAGNSGDLGSSFRVSGSHPGAKQTWTWLSDPVPGEPNLIAG